MSASRLSERLAPALALALALLCPIPAAAFQTAAAGAVSSNGRVEYGSFPSASLGRDVAYAVSLPASYDRESSRRYPLVLFLHGLFNSERDWEGRGIQAQIDRLRAEGKIGEFIVAVPYGANSFYLNAKDGTKYEDAIVRDFLPFVDRTFRTTAKPSERVIQGISMGGFGALVIAFKHPEMFTAVAAHCAAIFEELPRVAAATDRRGTYRYEIATKIFGNPPDDVFFKANNPLGLAEARSGKIKGLKIYFDVGEQDRYGFATGNRSFDELLTKAGVPHEFHLTAGDHGWAYLVSRSVAAFVFVSKALGAK
jgi:S-formylglutathione hydrolase FrmB